MIVDASLPIFNSADLLEFLLNINLLRDEIILIYNKQNKTLIIFDL